MPLSPHLQVWRWHVTMAASIFTRATGVALYVGLFVVVGWAASLATGPGSYDLFMVVMASWLGKLVLFGLSLSIFYHLAAGLRHLAFDSGRGFEPKTADMTAVICIAFALVATVAVWILAYFIGAV
ncbi:MAG TPA: succinate dehydrogenase, cytochrome b556 subunit [Caulobacteraceae bacterium]|jgi:succinate dehydrogenase / fumarate reductase cytochrome b subunit|nr:succinate dehydrogenase, cytochrome b556 subunit [Caulobacteraceae bacterium]